MRSDQEEHFATSWTMSTILTLVNGIGLLASTVIFLTYQSRFSALYDGLFQGKALPKLTAFLLSVPPAFAVLTAVALAGVLIAKESLRPEWVPVWINIVWFVCGVLLLGACAEVLMAPIAEVYMSSQ